MTNLKFESRVRKTSTLIHRNIINVKEKRKRKRKRNVSRWLQNCELCLYRSLKLFWEEVTNAHFYGTTVV
jgi:hypothetical protein